MAENREYSVHFESWFLILVCMVSSVGFLVNWRCCSQVWNDYNIQKALYLVLFSNTLFTTICLLLTSLTSLKMLSDSSSKETAQHNFLKCSLLIDGIVVSLWLGAFAVSAISILRLDILKYGSSDERNKLHITYFVVAMILALLYISSHTILSTMMDFHPIVTACSLGPGNVIEDVRVMGLFGMPHDLMAIISMCVDARTYFVAKSRAFKPPTRTGAEHDPNNEIVSKSNSKENHKTLDVPLKATVLSTMFTLPGLTLGILSSLLNLTLFYKQHLVFIFFLIMTMVRMPFIMTLTFRRNELNKAITQEAIREENRRLEIQHALRERERRRQVWVP